MLKIITISGLDGSGKSTQTELLKNYLEAQKKRVFYFHAVEFSFGNKIANRFKIFYNTLLRPQISVIKEKSNTSAGWITVQLRKIFLSIDLARFKRLVKKLENQGFDYILSDRYFYDSVVNIAYLVQQRHSCESKNLEKFSWIPHQVRNDNIVKSALAIYLQSDPEIIMQRERIPDQGIEYLKKKKDLYDNFAREFNLTIINGNRNQEEIFDEIKNLVIKDKTY
ncbi:MAG: hypothetical protein NT136_03865 [Candidatus Moranbacteria bacterium]|nr:hypothetical protein [Candidatus Moranbacteria bacterium]